MMQKKLLLFLLFFFLINFVSGENNITLNYPIDKEPCLPLNDLYFRFYLGAPATYCNLIINGSDKDADMDIVATLTSPITNQFNIINWSSLNPGVYNWSVSCMMTTPSPNRLESSSADTFTLTNAPYCAVLSSGVCPENAPIGDTIIFKTVLSNTNGLLLENQDGNVFITNSKGKIVKQFDTLMVNAEQEIQLDKNGNWINIAKSKVPLTDSGGNYVVPIFIDSSWAFYGDSYTINAVLNSQLATCNFNVTERRLPDTNEWGILFKTGGGLLVLLSFFVLLLIGSYKLIKIRLK